MKRFKGFTLIELIIVIVILGILAAYAVPKYMNIDRESRIAVVKGLRGSISAAADMVHAIAVSKGVSGSVNIGTINIPIGTDKYPTGLGINDTLSDTSGFSISPAATNALATFVKTGATVEANCSVSYNPSTTPPTISHLEDGC